MNYLLEGEILLIAGSGTRRAGHAVRADLDRTLTARQATGGTRDQGVDGADAQAALRHGAGWAMLFAGVGACGLALLSRYFFRRGR